MDKKKFLGVVCAGALALNLEAAQPASAGIYFPNFSAGQQESMAKSFVRKEFGSENPPGDSYDARQVKPILLRLQDKLCRENGIEVTEEKFRHVRDSISGEGDRYVSTYHTGFRDYRLIVRERSYNADENAYFGGQLAYCIAKDALNLDNICLLRNTMKDELNFKGDYLLVCWSEGKLPNNYRILADGIYGSEAKVLQQLRSIKASVRREAPLSTYEEMARKYINRGDSSWKIWLACAVAGDMEYRSK